MDSKIFDRSEDEIFSEPEKYKKYGDSCLKGKKYQDALIHYETALEKLKMIFSKHSDCLVKNFSKATQLINTIGIPCHLNMSLCYYHLEKWNESVAECTKVLELDKKNIKAVLVYKKGKVCGIDEESLAWNGGNIYPVEMEGSEEEIRSAISKVFADREYVKAKNLTVANTTNVCRLLSQIFFFPYSFAQIKKKVDGDIYYSMDAGNYGTLVAGLYSWRFALPVNGFLVPSTAALARSPSGNPVLLDSMVDVSKRSEINPITPANIERLESFFGKNELMMRNFVFPIDVSERQREKAAKELFIKYGLYADRATAAAYASIKEARDYDLDEDCSVVLTAYNDPSLDAEYCRHVLGEAPEMPENIKASMKPLELNRPLISSLEELKAIIDNL